MVVFGSRNQGFYATDPTYHREPEKIIEPKGFRKKTSLGHPAHWVNWYIYILTCKVSLRRKTKKIWVGVGGLQGGPLV